MPEESASRAPRRALREVLVGRQRGLDVDQTDDPVAELLVVEDAAEARVLEVAVGVDEAGQDHGLAEVDHVGLRPGGAHVGGGARLTMRSPSTATAPPANGGAVIGRTQSAQ